MENHSNPTEELDAALKSELKVTAAIVHRAINRTRQQQANMGKQQQYGHKNYDSTWWETTTGLETYNALYDAQTRSRTSPEAQREFQYLDGQLRDRYDISAEELLDYFQDHGLTERALQRHEEKTAQQLEGISDEEHELARKAPTAEDASFHEENSHDAHQQALSHWDRADERANRVAYYEGRFDQETAHSMKVSDKSLGVHPRVALQKAKSAKKQPKPARTQTHQAQQVRRSRELSR
jgi:hypothetical protein